MGWNLSGFKSGNAAKKASPSKNIPAILLNLRIVDSVVKRFVIKPTPITAGNVPSPKAIIVNALPTGSPVVVARASAIYTSPHGNQPQIIPKKSACGSVLTGIKR